MSCRIYLENGGRFSTGDEIIGRIDCYFNESTKLRCVKVRLECKEHNEWIESEKHYDTTTNRTQNREVTYTGDHVVLSNEKILYGSGSGQSRLPVGRYSYPFQFVLPTNLPASFQGIYGCVTYTVKAIVERPWCFDYQDTCILDVKSPLYVDRFSSEDLTPATFEDNKTVCCLCCTGGEISMCVTMARMVFVPGEAIFANVQLINLSNRDVNKLRIKLKKTVKFKVTSPKYGTKTSDTEILNISEHGVGAHGEHTYNLCIVLPDYVEVPNFTNCKLFDIQYQFQIEACIGGCSTNLQIKTYPTLAHVASQRISNIPTSSPGFNVSPLTSRPTAPSIASDDVVYDITPSSSTAIDIN